jgi:hypothetical protein
MTREELVEKLKQNRNSEGLFTVSNTDENEREEADDKLTDGARVYHAFEKFEKSLDKTPLFNEALVI